MKLAARAYVAGFFDGEGSIGVYSRRDRTNPNLRTQMTQNVTKESTILFREVEGIFGGNLSKQVTLSGKVKYNWQLNGDKAGRFLRAVLPFLRLKKDQAWVASAWQSSRPSMKRDNRGRICAENPVNRALDIKVMRLLKALKHQDIDTVMARQTDLVEVVTELKQIMSIKGAE